jgi:hypothetical protein
MRAVFLAAVLALSLVACGGVTKDYGHGPCQEYEPLCISGREDCTVDSRGCRVCTCLPEGSVPKPYGPVQRDP